MTTSLDITKVTFGSDDAELDKKRGFLDKVFLKTSIYHRCRNVQRELVVGRKGTGKSAICLMLKETFENEGITTILITPKWLSSHKLEQLKVSSINTDESYVLGWKYVLLVMIATEILREIKSATLPIPKQNKNEIKKYLKYLRKFLVANDEVEHTLLESILKKSGIFSKFSIKAFGVEGSIETQQLKTQKDAADELERVQTKLEVLLASLEKFQLVILIDRVDEVWNQSEESEMMIIGLIKAVHDINTALYQTQSILFLRADIYDILKFNDADKFHSLEERLDWKEEDLKHLIAMRAKVSAGLNITDVDDLWNTIFASKVNGKSSFHYMIERTMMRPREIIQFCNIALAEAQDNNHTYIHAEDILSAEKQYSSWKLKDLASEFIVQYPYLEEVLALFQGFKPEFSLEEFDNRFQETKNKLISRYPDLNQISTDKMLQILFIIGFLGTRVGRKSVFSDDDPMILLPQQETILIHPVFYLALGIKGGSGVTITESSIIAGEGSVIGSTSGGHIVTGDKNIAGDIVSGDKIVIDHYDPKVSSNREVEHLKSQYKELLEKRHRLEIQKAKYGFDVPVRVLTELEDIESQIFETQRKIDRLQQYLSSR